jgi:acyl-CoA thioesterase-1
MMSHAMYIRSVAIGCLIWIMGTTGIRSETTAAADPQTYLQDVCKQLEKQWPENRTIRIVCHGHSVPAGFFKTPVVDTFNAYPHLLHVGLKKRFPYAVIEVIVTAIGGENSMSGEMRFKEEVLALKPDVLLIDYALNDRGMGLEKAKKAWTSMVLQAKEQGVKTILLTPTADTRSDISNPADPLNQHAQQVRELASEHRVGIVDSFALFQAYVSEGKPLVDLMSQINHPNRKGHDLVADALLEWFPEP